MDDLSIGFLWLAIGGIWLELSRIHPPGSADARSARRIAVVVLVCASLGLALGMLGIANAADCPDGYTCQIVEPTAVATKTPPACHWVLYYDPQNGSDEPSSWGGVYTDDCGTINRPCKTREHAEVRARDVAYQLWECVRVLGLDEVGIVIRGNAGPATPTKTPPWGATCWGPVTVYPPDCELGEDCGFCCVCRDNPWTRASMSTATPKATKTRTTPPTLTPVPATPTFCPEGRPVTVTDFRAPTPICFPDRPAVATVVACCAKGIQRDLAELRAATRTTTPSPTPTSTPTPSDGYESCRATCREFWRATPTTTPTRNPLDGGQSPACLALHYDPLCWPDEKTCGSRDAPCCSLAIAEDRAHKLIEAFGCVRIWGPDGLYEIRVSNSPRAPTPSRAPWYTRLWYGILRWLGSEAEAGEQRSVGAAEAGGER